MFVVSNVQALSPVRLNNPCLNTSSKYAKQPWCNAELPIDARVKDMISRLSVAEKIDALDTSEKPLDSLGLNSYNWWSEATHGISHVSNNPSRGTQFETNFAFPITTAMSFNRTMWWATGQQIGREARAFMNVGDAWSTYWAPVINLAREPRWGRNLETPGEDPYLSGEYATQWVQGLERSEDDPSHIQASACCKHYAANSMESSTVAGQSFTRQSFDANISMRDLVDSYLLPFQACVEKGKVSGLMCSYNSINGVPSCANTWLLTEVARDAWGFDGYITSDCDADANVLNPHHYTATAEEAVAAVLHAGTDVDCTSFVGQHAQSALDKGLITEADMDLRLSYLFRVRMRLGHFDPVGPLQQIPVTDVCSDASKALARDGVAQSVVLLKNVNSLLPLAKQKTVAVLGPQANYSKGAASYYAGNSCDNYGMSADDGLAKAMAAFSRVLTHEILPTATSADLTNLATATAMAAAADVTVLALGTDLSYAHEGMDAVDIRMPLSQLALVDAAANASASPLVVVFFGSTPLDISPLLANDKVGAIVHVGQPSVQLGGVADVLYGVKVPAGRLVQTFLPGDYMDMISIFDFNMRPGPSAWPRPDCTVAADKCPRGINPGRTHRFYTGQPVVPFGFGLSYTQFRYQMHAAPTTVSLVKCASLLTQGVAGKPAFPSLASAGPAVSYAVNVTNTGSIDADDVVLGFLVPPGAGKDGVPLRSLFGFERVHVPAGTTATVWLYPTDTDFAIAREDGNRVPLAGDYTVQFGVKETFTHGQGFAEVTLAAHL